MTTNADRTTDYTDGNALNQHLIVVDQVLLQEASVKLWPPATASQLPAHQESLSLV